MRSKTFLLVASLLFPAFMWASYTETVVRPDESDSLGIDVFFEELDSETMGESISVQIRVTEGEGIQILDGAFATVRFADGGKGILGLQRELDERGGCFRSLAVSKSDIDRIEITIVDRLTDEPIPVGAHFILKLGEYWQQWQNQPREATACSRASS